MSDELDGVRQYLNDIDPPDARTIAEVKSRFHSPAPASGIVHGRTDRTKRISAVRWAGVFLVVLAVGVALLVPTLSHRSPTRPGDAHTHSARSSDSARCGRCQRHRGSRQLRHELQRHHDSGDEAELCTESTGATTDWRIRTKDNCYHGPAMCDWKHAAARGQHPGPAVVHQWTRHRRCQPLRHGDGEQRGVPRTHHALRQRDGCLGDRWGGLRAVRTRPRWSRSTPFRLRHLGRGNGRTGTRGTGHGGSGQRHRLSGSRGSRDPRNPARRHRHRRWCAGHHLPTFGERSPRPRRWWSYV